MQVDAETFGRVPRQSDPLVDAYIRAIAQGVHHVLNDMWVSATTYAKSTGTTAREHVRSGLREITEWSLPQSMERMAPTIRNSLMVRDLQELKTFNKLTFMHLHRLASRRLQHSTRERITSFRSLSWQVLSETTLKALITSPEVTTCVYFLEMSPADQLAYLVGRVEAAIRTRIHATAKREPYRATPRRHSRGSAMLPPPTPTQRPPRPFHALPAAATSSRGMDLFPTLSTHITASDSASQVAARIQEQDEQEEFAQPVVTARAPSVHGGKAEEAEPQPAAAAASAAAAAAQGAEAPTVPEPTPAVSLPKYASSRSAEKARSGFAFDGVSVAGSVAGSVRLAQGVKSLEAGTVISVHPIVRA